MRKAVHSVYFIKDRSIHATGMHFGFQEVIFMDSSGIAVVINTLRNMTKLDGKLEISGLGQQPMKVFRASGIDKLVNIKEEVK